MSRMGGGGPAGGRLPFMWCTVWHLRQTWNNLVLTLLFLHMLSELLEGGIALDSGSPRKRPEHGILVQLLCGDGPHELR